MNKNIRMGLLAKIYTKKILKFFGLKSSTFCLKGSGHLRIGHRRKARFRSNPLDRSKHRHVFCLILGKFAGINFDRKTEL